jgi:hypothetical protein
LGKDEGRGGDSGLSFDRQVKDRGLRPTVRDYSSQGESLLSVSHLDSPWQGRKKTDSGEVEVAGQGLL